MPRSSTALDAEAKLILQATISITERRPKNYSEPDETDTHEAPTTPSPASGKTNWCFIICLSLLFCGIITLRILQDSYSYDYDAFTKNYEILGLPTSEDLTQRNIKEAYTPLALKW
jgi:hypothetical protein